MKNKISYLLAMIGLFVGYQMKAQTTAPAPIKPIGIITVSVGNIRTEPAQSAELSTQSLLGTPVKILEKALGKNWFRIQMPDEYQGWIDGGALARMDSVEFKEFKKSGTELMVIHYLGYLYALPSEKSEILSELVFQNRLMGIKFTLGFWKIQLPNGEIGFVSNKMVEPYANWLKKNSEPTQNSMLKTAHELLGIPYLWGGTSVKGLDCSGFTKTIFQANGWILPRDASQQAQEGILVDSTRNWENLIPGDLVFFGEKRPNGTYKVVHVGFWEGNQTYLQASEKTRRGSMNPQSKDFDAYNLSRYLFTKRINKAGNMVKSMIKSP